MFWTEFVIFDQGGNSVFIRQKTLILTVAAPKEAQARSRVRREETIPGLPGRVWMSRGQRLLTGSTGS